MFRAIPVILLFFLFSCQKKSKPTNKYSEKHCWQKRALFEPADSFPVLVLDFAQPDSSWNTIE